MDRQTDRHTAIWHTVTSFKRPALGTEESSSTNPWPENQHLNHRGAEIPKTFTKRKILVIPLHVFVSPLRQINEFDHNIYPIAGCTCHVVP